ncbi:P-loop containing nucleoside triphosphate hydrolase protein [Acephala macrosclerotiorum]|nr:P-loop containing nucleoside triphosphate hydrolase protein [Acephala macrosclerotiorum]
MSSPNEYNEHLDKLRPSDHSLSVASGTQVPNQIPDLDQHLQMDEQMLPQTAPDPNSITGLGQDIEDFFSENPAEAARESEQAAMDREANEDDFEGGAVSGDEAEMLEESTAMDEENAAASGGSLLPTAAVLPEQSEQQLATPRPTESPEAKSAPLSSVNTPNGADIEMGNTPHSNKASVKQEPRIEEEPVIKQEPVSVTDIRSDDDEIFMIKPPSRRTWNSKNKTSGSPKPVSIVDATGDTDDETTSIPVRNGGLQKFPTPPDDAELIAMLQPVIEEVRPNGQLPQREPEEPALFVDGSNLEGTAQQEDAQEERIYHSNDDFEDEDNVRDDPTYTPDGAAPAPSSHRERSAPSQRKSGGSKPKTAREWHKRRQANLKPSQRRGTAWKLQELEKLHERIKAGTRKRKAPRPTNQPDRKRVDPRVFLGGGTDNPVSPRRSGRGGQPQNSSTTKKHWWKMFLEQNHGIDLHKSTKDKNILLEKSRTFGYRRMGPSGKSTWRLAGMPTTLLPHQVIGVAFMTERECSEDGPRGSICADDMGMGKTIQTIGVMYANPPSPEHVAAGKTATLIVVPSSILKQWLAELQLHAGDYGQKVLEYHSSDDSNTIAKMKMHDIVLTTYWELFTSLPQPSKQTVQDWIAMRPKVDLFKKYQQWVEDHKDQKGPLHQIDWYRIVLDEGHYIKNYMSRTSRAAVDLEGEHRLILSGTPIMNSYEEFHPLLRFLREPITYNMPHEEFEEKFCGEPTDEEAVQALSILISDLIIHRTMKDELFDRPIIPLPKDHRSVTGLVAQKPELILMGAFVRRLHELKLQTFEQRDERRRLKHPFANLTRQRQLSASPDIVSRQIIAVFSVAELEDLRGMMKRLRKSKSKKDMAHMLHSRLKLWIQEKKSGVYTNAAPEDDDELVCVRCKMPGDPLYTLKNCKHIFCDPCLQECVIRDTDDFDNDILRCPKCGKDFKQDDPKPIIPKGAKQAKSNAVKTAIGKGKDARKFRPMPAPNQLCYARWLEKFDQGKIDLLPSAKLLGIREQVKKWLKEAPKQKIIVFTQFRPFQTMVGCSLEQLRIKFVYLSGDMSKDQRKKALKIFREDGSVNVMIAGLKCGGLGLNLAFANRVIIAEMWWNTCIDSQAFGRVFRLGQLEETYYVKASVNETIDQRLLLVLQRKKATAISKAMQDDLNAEELEEVVSAGSDETFEEFLAREGADIQPDYSGATGEGFLDGDDSDSD